MSKMMPRKKKKAATRRDDRPKVAPPPRVRPKPPATRQLEDVADVFAALGDPTRVRIISHLLYGEAGVGELATALGFSLSAVSHQLRRLKDLKIVRSHKEGKNVYYALEDAHVAGLFQMALDHVRHKKTS